LSASSSSKFVRTTISVSSTCIGLGHTRPRAGKTTEHEPYSSPSARRRHPGAGPLTVYYVRHALRNDRLVRDEPAVWVIFLIALNAFSQPVYWYRYIWRRGDVAAVGACPGPLAAPAEPGQWQQVGPEKP
jgi:hypothetical protein